MWYVRDVLYAVLYIRVSCIVVHFHLVHAITVGMGHSSTPNFLNTHLTTSLGTLKFLLQIHKSIVHLKATLDNHAPIKHKYITVRPYNPWYDDEIHMVKLAKRKAEKQARTSGLTVYEEIYTFHRNLVNCLLDKKKHHFF